MQYPISFKHVQPAGSKTPEAPTMLLILDKALTPKPKQDATTGRFEDPGMKQKLAGSEAPVRSLAGSMAPEKQRRCATGRFEDPGSTFEKH